MQVILMATTCGRPTAGLYVPSLIYYILSSHPDILDIFTTFAKFQIFVILAYLRLVGFVLRSDWSSGCKHH